MGRAARKLSLSWSWVLQTSGMIALVLVVFGPLLMLLAETGQFLAGNGWAALHLALPGGRALPLLARSLALALAVAGGGLALGVLATSLLWQWRCATVRYLRWLPLALIAIPPYVHALAWIGAADACATALRSLGVPPPAVPGWLAAWWVQLLALLPVALGLTLLGLETVEPRLIEAARVQRRDIDALTRVVLPLAAPALLAGGGLLFLLSVTDYSIPALFQVNVYALAIFADYSAYHEPARTVLLALPLVAVTAAVAFAIRRTLRHAAQQPFAGERAWASPARWPTWLKRSQRLALAVVIAQCLVPLASLMLLTGSAAQLAEALAIAHRELVFTVATAALAALACLPLALAAARRLAAPRGAWWLVVLLPLAVPAPLVGIGLIELWNRPGNPLYGSDAMPALAALARYTPLAALILFAQLKRIDPALIEAARVLQSSALQTWWRVRVPLLAPGLLAAGFLVLALSMGELGATLLVVPPGRATLTLRIYNYLHYGASQRVAGLSLLVTAVALAAGVAATAALRGWLRLLPGRGTAPR